MLTIFYAHPLLSGVVNLRLHINKCETLMCAINCMHISVNQKSNQVEEIPQFDHKK